MPNTNDAAKRHRQNLKRRIHNRSIRSRVRTSAKAFEEAVAKNDKVVAESKYHDFVKLIDTASGKGVYKCNTSSRKKSRMHKKLVALD